MNRDDDLQRLADVISPPPPDLQAWWFTAGAVLILAVAALVIWRLRRRRTLRRYDPRTDAQAQLRTLRGAWEARPIGDRAAAYRLAAVLRLGLGLPQQSESPPPAAAGAAALWCRLALPLPALVWWAWRRRPPRRAAALFHPHAELLAGLAAHRPTARRWPWLWIAGCALLVTALARPVWIDLLPGDYPARDFMIAIDTSGSMRAQDFILDGQPADRLAVVKKTVDALLAARRGDRAGLIVFGDAAVTVSPVSHDLELVRRLLRAISNGVGGAGVVPFLGGPMFYSVLA